MLEIDECRHRTYIYSMPYNEFSSWYYGNDKYYALSLEGSLYNICYENRIISTQKYKFVNFTNDKILIAGDLNGECIFMDYSLNEKLRAKRCKRILEWKSISV